MRAKEYKRSNVKCDRCVGNSMCGELGDAALNCVDRIITRQTNADRIRSMSDEELVGFIRAIYMSEECPLCTLECETCFLKEACAGICCGKEIEWLQKPSE